MLAPGLVSALHTMLTSVRGILKIEQLEPPGGLVRSLLTTCWIAGDVCVSDHGTTPLGEGIKVCERREDEPELLLYSRAEVEAIVADLILNHAPVTPGKKLPQSRKRNRVDTIILHTQPDALTLRPIIPADVLLFEMAALSDDFEQRLVDVVIQNIAKKNYKNEVVVWSWVGHGIGSGNRLTEIYYVGVTGRRQPSMADLFRGVQPEWFEAGGDRLGETAKPLLRWKPGTGLIRYWVNDAPEDETIHVGTRDVPLLHRIGDVVRRETNSNNSVAFRINKLRFANYRNYETAEYRFNSQFHVVIGENGRGKTALLDGLATILRVMVESRDNGELLRDVDVTEHLSFHHGDVSAERRYPAMATASLRLTAKDAQEETLTRDEHASKRSGPLGAFMNHLVERLRKQGAVDLPLCAYYGIARAHQPTESVVLEVGSPVSRLAGYAQALDNRLDPIPFQRWFKRMEFAALQDRKPNVLLETVREAVRQCVEGCTAVQHVIVRDELMLEFENGSTRPFRQLSDGYRLMLAMVADIAYRCVVLNPHLGSAATTETSGVVLIDEIDLHLHPRWQRHVVDDLRLTFPKLQFIATTHSPLIVQSMKAHEVINLDENREELDYQASSPEDILEEVMGIDGIQRGKRFHDMERAAAEYYQLLKDKPATDEAAQELKAKLDELMLPFADNAAYVAYLKTRRAVKGLD